MAQTPNRIRELRAARGWTLEDLAQRVSPPTTAMTISRLETGSRKLTEDWLLRLSAALGVHPMDLLILADSDQSSDVSEPGSLVPQQLLDLMRKRGMQVYVVTSDTVTLAGIDSGDLITIDGKSDAEPGSVVLIEAGGRKLLRVLAGHGMVSTARVGTNTSCRVIDLGSDARIIGAVIDGDAPI